MITDKDGKVRLIFNPSTKKLDYDFNMAVCGDTYCDDTENCSNCQEDCGMCPPAACGSK
jgi:hypothetical protein